MFVIWKYLTQKRDRPMGTELPKFQVDRISIYMCGKKTCLKFMFACTSKIEGFSIAPPQKKKLQLQYLESPKVPTQSPTGALRVLGSLLANRHVHHKLGKRHFGTAQLAGNLGMWHIEKVDHFTNR